MMSLKRTWFYEIWIDEEKGDVKDGSKLLKEKEWIIHYKGLWSVPHRDEQNRFK
jgi:hypothetical protein